MLTGHIQMTIKSRTWCIPVLLFFASTLAGCAPAQAKSDRPGYANHHKARSFIDGMVKDHGFDRADLESLFSEAKRRDDIIELMSKPAEKKLRWFEYRKIFLTSDRIEGGVTFWKAHADILKRAHETFGVDPQIIVAIIGVETRYGGNTGRHRVLDALSTLAFDYPPRSKFFTGELEHFL
ncbi:MAG: lytic murein transglycosylase, partial [Gammaproteobacteria bacterium]|nr:lytic murein transglycosylase [Gammaproteobacteria bacterium]